MIPGTMELVINRQLPESLSGASLLDAAGNPIILRDLWRESPALLVFLRHFGCIACSEHMAELIPRLNEFKRIGVPVICIGNGALRYMDGFRERLKLADKDIFLFTDPELTVYNNAGLKRSLLGTFGPRAAWNFLRAMGRGFSQTTIEGDVAQQGGVMLIDKDGSLVYYYRSKRLGDHPDTSDILEAAYRLYNSDSELPSI